MKAEGAVKTLQFSIAFLFGNFSAAEQSHEKNSEFYGESQRIGKGNVRLPHRRRRRYLRYPHEKAQRRGLSRESRHAHVRASVRDVCAEQPLCGLRPLCRPHGLPHGFLSSAQRFRQSGGGARARQGEFCVHRRVRRGDPGQQERGMWQLSRTRPRRRKVGGGGYVGGLTGLVGRADELQSIAVTLLAVKIRRLSVALDSIMDQRQKPPLP